MKWVVFASAVAVLHVAVRSSSRGQAFNETARAAGAETVELVAFARRGDNRAWSEILKRYLPLIRAVARGYRLGNADVDDVSQTVCLHLVEHLERIQEPCALPAWITTTARRESLKVVRRQRQTIPVDHLDEANRGYYTVATCDDLDARLLRSELTQVLRDGLNGLPRHQRDLLLLLTGERALGYREIGSLLAMPIGSIGPTRSRSLAKLRATPAVRDYLGPGEACPRRQPASPETSGMIGAWRE